VRPSVVAIDGPAGSGKSTVARAVAERLGLPYLDTGAMYRSIAYAVLRDGLDPHDAAEVSELARGLRIAVDDRVLVDGDDVTTAIRGPEVTAIVSAVSAHAAVRKEMVRRQRAWAQARGGGVVEGRDIGSVVFPAAPVKVFLTADERERARRRAREEGATDRDGVAADLARRDHLDSTRATAPLTAAPDAFVIDTTGRSVDEVVESVLVHAEGRLP
jgi:cytidylate kinase